MGNGEVVVGNLQFLLGYDESICLLAFISWFGRNLVEKGGDDAGASL